MKKTVCKAMIVVGVLAMLAGCLPVPDPISDRIDAFEASLNAGTYDLQQHFHPDTLEYDTSLVDDLYWESSPFFADYIPFTLGAYEVTIEDVDSTTVTLPFESDAPATGVLTLKMQLSGDVQLIRELHLDIPPGPIFDILRVD